MRNIPARIIFILATVVWGSAPVAAQDRTAVERAKTQLAAAGVDMAGPCGAAKITNLVAWNARPAYGLLWKQGGNRAALKADGSCLGGDATRDAGFATDYLIDRRTGGGYDLLSDGGGANGPQWAGPENDPATVARNFQNFAEPLDPAAYLGASAPPAVVIPPPLFDTSALQAQIAQLQATVDILARADADAHASLNQNITDGRAENRSFFSAIGDHWRSITMIASPIATGLVCHYTGKC